MHKGIIEADFSAEHVLSNDPWLYVELWLKRSGKRDCLSYWLQARRFYEASHSIAIEAKPLVLYYCFLNAVKALLECKGLALGSHHGVSGSRPASARASLVNELVEFKSGGVLPDLCGYFGESSGKVRYSLSDILWNIPFVHRAYRLTFTSKAELFIPLERARYVKKLRSSEAYFEAEIIPRFSDRRRLADIPRSFEVFDDGDKTFVRRKKCFKWFDGRSSVKKVAAASTRLQNYHASTRRAVVSISGNRDLWYLKKQHPGNSLGARHTVILLFAAMHRLSELSRYDPAGLDRHFNGKANWLLTEFIESSQDQFIDQIATEITGFQFWPPKTR